MIPNKLVEVSNRLTNLNERPLAFTDLETSGDIFCEHEILEIGLVVADQGTLEIIDTLSIKIKPEHIENAFPAALERNGFKAENWLHAVSLNKGLQKYAEKTKGAIFVAYNVAFDWGFMSEGFRKTGVKNILDYHRLDVLTLAWQRGLKDNPSWKMEAACKMFGVSPESGAHGALSGAMTCFKLYKKLVS
ncbi:MAG: 3'-5' exonuclease [Patescibacteria group bacterium]